LIDARQPQADLRLGADYQPASVKTIFRFPEDGGSLANATLRCVGVGACRKEEGGAMCPSYMATREEKHSTRGRAHLLWELLQGEVLEGGWKNEDVKEALDLCLSCKACKTECPTNVDLASYKAEFLAHYYEGRRRPLYAYAFGLIDRWARMASRTPRLANALGRFPPTAGMAKSLLHIAPQRTFPEFAASTFRARIRARETREPVEARPGSRGAKGKVLLWADTFTNYFQPHIAEAAHQVALDEALGDPSAAGEDHLRELELRATPVTVRHVLLDVVELVGIEPTADEVGDELPNRSARLVVHCINCLSRRIP
jgi:ferredoxin